MISEAGWTPRFQAVIPQCQTELEEEEEEEEEGVTGQEEEEEEEEEKVEDIEGIIQLKRFFIYLFNFLSI